MARSLDDTAKYLIKILRRGGQAANEVEKLIKAGRDDVIKKAVSMMSSGATSNQVALMIHGEIAKLQGKTTKSLVTAATDAAVIEAGSTAAYLGALGVGSPKQVKVTKAFIRQTFDLPFPHQLISVNNLLTGTFAGMDVALVNVVRDAIARGDTIRSTSDYIRRSTGKLEDPTVRRNSNALARTAVIQVSNQVRAKAFEEEDEVAGVLYVSTLDHRTSDICMSLDGQYWADKSQARVPPLHVSCRSSLAPVLKGENIDDVKDQLTRPAVEVKSVGQLEEQGLRTSGGRIRKPSKTGRSPLKGVVKNQYVTYEQWIKTQPVAYQQSILGRKAYSVLRETGSLSKALGFAD